MESNMNERIKEFDDSAHFYADEHWLRGPKWHEFYIEKFAELIINECSQISEDHQRIYYESHGDRIAKKIKQHFGVEE
jgi:hypothetical protein